MIQKWVMRYRRPIVPGATLFLTLVTHQRKPLLADTRIRSALRHAMIHVAQRHPFSLRAFVVLPDHCHWLWELPGTDADFSLRIRLIKHHMACQRGMPRPIWQKRFWEHIVRDDADLGRHIDYIHQNPVKHGWVQHPSDWPDSSFHRFLERGYYTSAWSNSTP